MRLDLRSFLRSKQRLLDLSPHGRRQLIVKGRTGVYLVPSACPHQGLPLARATLEGDVIICHWHGCRFRVVPSDDGAAADRLASQRLDVSDGMVELLD